MTEAEQTYSNFGEYIKMLRLHRRLSIVKASKRMGFSPQKLCDIEMGRRYKKRVTVILLKAVADAYKVPMAEIIRHTTTAISHDKTVTEILDEVWPKSRFSELLADSLVKECAQYAPEIETKAIELYNSVKETRGLLSLLRKRHNKIDTPVEESDSHDE